MLVEHVGEGLVGVDDAAVVEADETFHGTPPGPGTDSGALVAHGELDTLKGREWDAVIDNSGYVPRMVGASARLLADNVPDADAETVARLKEADMIILGRKKELSGSGILSSHISRKEPSASR